MWAHRPGDPVVVGPGAPTVLLVDRVAHPEPSGRDLVRQVAAAHAGVPVDRVAVRDGGPDGDKPTLVGAELAFNLSDTDDWLALALAVDGEVGVDIEPADRRTVHTRRLAERVLTPEELAPLTDLDDEALDAALVRAWTRKEAVLKACGLGLRRDLRTLDVGADVVTIDGVAWRCHTEAWGPLVVSVAWPACPPATRQRERFGVPERPRRARWGSRT